MKIKKNIALVTLIISTQVVISQVHLTEGFETGSKPEGWTEEAVSGNEPWRYRNGGHSPNDNNWQVPAGDIDITRNPPGAYEGTYNAIFFKQSDNNEKTKLITPEMDLLGATSLELSFYLCQIPWTFEGSTGWDVLRVYYKVSEGSPWVLLHEYLDPVYEWEQKTLALPNPSATYYVAFEGHTRWGYGTCIDDVVIQETASTPMYVGEVDFEQPFSNFVPSGSTDVPMMRVDMKVFGNTDSVELQSIQFTSLNTTDADLEPGGVKLFSTSTQTFDTDQQLGASTDFNAGVASFTGLSHILPAGTSYLWLTYDVKLDATHENLLDAMVKADAITANGLTYPASDQSPTGQREIYTTRYQEDFEGAHGWTLSGEFEVGSPSGMGGDPGNPDPSEAFSGSNILGTDLSGLGANPYNYEPGLNAASAYLATSPNVDALYYKNLNLFYMRYLNIEVWDEAAIEISIDNGTTWNILWDNNYITDYQWGQEQLPIPSQYTRTDSLMIRFRLGPTTGFNNYSGWNIDDIFLTGEFISKDVGVSQWIYPKSGSGHTDNDSVTVVIRNYGGAEIVDPVPVAYSFDGGVTWKTDLMNENIPVEGSVEYTFPTGVDLSQPGLRPNVLAKTILPGDQFTGNDLFSTQVYIVPTYTPPYAENFDSGEGYWRSLGNGLWEHGTPNGATINSAYSGTGSWATSLEQRYGDVLADQNKILFTDGFEAEEGWVFTGEFERDIPSNIYLPYFARTGYYCIGTDLTGLGTEEHYYENGVTEGTAYTATSPVFDVTNYSNLRIQYQSWISIQDGDSIRLEVSPDNGNTWYTVWKNSEGGITEIDYQYREVEVPDEYTFTDQFRIRFSLFHTSAAGPVSEGWFIDDLQLLGDLAEQVPAYLASPSFDLTGLENPVITANLWIDSEQDVDGLALYYSLDDGENWTAVTNSSGYDTYWNWYTGDPVSSLGTDGWSGQGGGWMPVRHLLPSSLLDQENVQFRFAFSADKSNNHFDGAAIDDIQVMEAPADLDMVDIIAPVSSCELGEDQKFTIRMTNNGFSALETGDSIQVGYHIDREGDVQEAEESFVLSQSWPAGNTINLAFQSGFDFSSSGDYQVTVYFSTADPHFYSQASNDTLIRNIQVNKPAVDFGEDISTLRPDTVLLKAYSGVPGQTYLWQDNSTDSVFQVSTDGTYYVRVTNGLGCIASDTVEVLQLVYDVGVSAYLGPQSACEMNDPVTMEVTVANLGTDTLEIGDTVYVGGIINGGNNFEDMVVLTERFYPGSTFDFTYSQLFDFSTPADYQLKLYTRASGDANPSTDTLYHTLEVWGYPDAYLGPDTIVMASEYVLSPESGYAGYLWQDGSTGETFTVDEPGLGQYYVTVNDENQCISYDTVQVTLNVVDLALEELLSPSTSCELSESITVSARIRNAGNQALPSGETVGVAYSINGGTIVREETQLTQNLLSGHTLDFTFSSPESVVTGQWYDFEVFVDYTNDSKRTNDTIVTSVGVFEPPALDLGDDYQVVTGFEHTLDAGPGFVSYLWQDGSTDQTFTIDQPGIGSYNVTVTDANACTAYDEIQILLAVPDVGVFEVAHPVTVCSLGDQEHVQVAVKNFGNWDIASTEEISVSYSINGSDEIVEELVLDEDLQSDSVVYHTFSQAEDLSEPGMYDILASVSYASDLIASNNLLLVSIEHKGSPVVDIGNGVDTMLIEEPVTLSATPGYASYEWQDGSSMADYQIIEPSAGWYRVIVTAGNGCETRDSVYVAYDRPDVALVGIASPQQTSCDLGQDEGVSLEILNNGYYKISTQDTLTITYSVNGQSSVIENLQLDADLPLGESRIISFDQGYDFSGKGTYQIQASLFYGPDENLDNNFFSGSVQHLVPTEVTIGNGADTVKGELPVSLDAGSGFTSYLWSDNSTTSAIQAGNYGIFWVQTTDDNGCLSFDSVYVASLTASPEFNDNEEMVRVYPNPARNILHVAIDVPVQNRVILELYTITNQLVYRKDIKSALVTEAHMDLEGLIPGAYYLKVTTDNKLHNFIILKE